MTATRGERLDALSVAAELRLHNAGVEDYLKAAQWILDGATYNSEEQTVLNSLQGVVLTATKEPIEPEHGFEVGDRVNHTSPFMSGNPGGTVLDTELVFRGQLNVLWDDDGEGCHAALENLVRPKPKVGDRVRKITEEQNWTGYDGLREAEVPAPKGARGRVKHKDSDGDLYVDWDGDPDEELSDVILSSQVAVIASGDALAGVSTNA